MAIHRNILGDHGSLTGKESRDTILGTTKQSPRRMESVADFVFTNCCLPRKRSEEEDINC